MLHNVVTLKQKENMGCYEIVSLRVRIWDSEPFRSTEHARIRLLSMHALSKKKKEKQKKRRRKKEREKKEKRERERKEIRT